MSIMLRDELESYLKDFLSIEDFNDYCPNGLQVEGKAEIRKIVTGVTASQQLIDEAINQEADAIIVHHGYFWKGEDLPIVNMKKQRIKKLLLHDISLFAYHLPLDAHPLLGNNIQLAGMLGLQELKALEKIGKHDLGLVGKFNQVMHVEELQQLLLKKLGRQAQVLGPESGMIKTLGLCTGAAQSMFEKAIVEHDVDAYLSGEVSEPGFHIAQEYQRNYFAVGHHASERYGVKALGEHLAEHFSLECVFIDCVNPV